MFTVPFINGMAVKQRNNLFFLDGDDIELAALLASRDRPTPFGGARGDQIIDDLHLRGLPDIVNAARLAAVMGVEEKMIFWTVFQHRIGVKCPTVFLSGFHLAPALLSLVEKPVI